MFSWVHLSLNHLLLHFSESFPICWHLSCFKRLVTLHSVFRAGKPFIDLVQPLWYNALGSQIHNYPCFQDTFKFQCTGICDIGEGMIWQEGLSPLGTPWSTLRWTSWTKQCISPSLWNGFPLHSLFLHFLTSKSFQLSPLQRSKTLVIFLPLALFFPDYVTFYLISNYGNAALVILTLVFSSAKIAPPSCCI